MADLKFTILADFSKFSKQLKDEMKKKFKLGVDILSGGKGGDAGAPTDGGKAGKKGLGLLGGIFKALAPLAVLLSLKPIVDLLSLATNFLGLIAFVVIKKFGGFLKDILGINEDQEKSIEQMRENLRNSFDTAADDIARDLGAKTEDQIKISKENIGKQIAANLFLKRISPDLMLQSAINSSEQKENRTVWQTIKDTLAGGLGFISDSISDVAAENSLFAGFLKAGLDSLRDSLTDETEELKNQLTSDFGAIAANSILNAGKTDEQIKVSKDSIAKQITGNLFLKSISPDMMLQSTKNKDEQEKSRTVVQDEFLSLQDVIEDTQEDTKNAIVDSINRLPSQIATSISSSRGGGGSRNFGDSSDEPPGFFQGKRVQGFNPATGNFEQVNDAIITKNGKVIRTNPNDSIIATQNPGATGGTNIINMFGVTTEKMIQEVERILGTSVNRSARF